MIHQPSSLGRCPIHDAADSCSSQMGQAPLGSRPDASQMLPTGSWVTVLDALAQEDIARLLCCPVREELLRHHWLEEKTDPSQRCPWQGSGIGQRSVPRRAPTPRSGPFASAPLPLPHHTGVIFSPREPQECYQARLRARSYSCHCFQLSLWGRRRLNLSNPAKQF